MLKINEEIEMDFPYDWTSGIGQDKPHVNQLLKSIIRGDIEEMNALFDKGATIEAMDELTFCVVINKVLCSYRNRYEIVRCLVEHGFNCLRTETWHLICKKKKEYQEWLASDETWCSPEFMERVFASADNKGL